ncbi:DNA cytosine methyltransferase [Umezawaea sp. NPDC059074]|uniref:DNA cytosine methyltransferase n=1 Tax=Umezawaea sp. NPDC059074 TaxID=3346716 RepID=UPI0036832259
MSESFYGVPLERSDYLSLARHRNSCAPEKFEQWLGKQSSDKRLAVDLFSGAGGLSLGLQRAGWTLAAAVDFDERALETHAANFPGMTLHMDLGNPDERDRLEELLAPAKGRIDLVAGGPPCQPFSRAGRSKIRHLVTNHDRDPQDLRKELWSAYMDVVRRLAPRAVLMENVPDMGLGDDFYVVRVIEEQLEDLGYATQVRLVDAWKHGVPQHRKRLILLARNDVDDFTWQDDVTARTFLGDAIGDLPKLEVVPTERIGERVMPYNTPAKEQSAFAVEMRKRAPQEVIHDHMTRRVREDDWTIFGAMSSKTLYSQIDENLRRYKADHFTDKYKKLAWEDLSRSITAHIAKDGYWYIHPDQNRTLTVREAARIQTFPDRFRFAGTRSDAFRQIGNAVPPLLGQAAANVLRPKAGVDTTPAGLTPKWRQVRAELTAWALEKQAHGEIELPKLSTLHATVVALLSSSRVQPGQVRAVLGSISDAKTLTKTGWRKLLESAPSQAVRARLEDKLADFVGKSSFWSEEKWEAIPGRLEMKPSEASLYKMLLGEDLLLIGQSTLRVAARLNASSSDRNNRLSDGRVDLVKLVGAGEQAPLRMAAVRLIGNTLCRATITICEQCPLRPYCVGRDSASYSLFSDPQ